MRAKALVARGTVAVPTFPELLKMSVGSVLERLGVVNVPLLPNSSVFEIEKKPLVMTNETSLPIIRRLLLND